MKCWEFPKFEKAKLSTLIPKFDHCETLYTKCDHMLEACVHEQLLKLEKEFKAHHGLMKREMKLQNKLIDELWMLSQRFLLLTNGGVCVKLYPEVVSEPTEQRILCEFNEKLRALNLSNCRISESLENIKDSLVELDHRCSNLDMTVHSIFLLGNAAYKPLAYTREIVTDLYKYFYGILCKLRCWAQLIDPGDSVAIEDYMALTAPSNDFENYLNIGIPYCQCKRGNNPDCFRPKQQNSCC